MIMSLLTKILQVLGVVFDWLTVRGRQRRSERREAENRRNEIVEELRRVNDEMLIRLTEMYRTVNDNNAQIAKLQLENAQLMKKLEITTQQLELLTSQNKALIAELKKKDKTAAAKIDALKSRKSTTRKPKGKAVAK